MIERIRLESPDEEYLVIPGDKEVIVVMCLENQIKLYERWGDRLYATLNQFETYTISAQYEPARIRTDNADGASFLLVHYYKA
jgi:hypothetical protein